MSKTQQTYSGALKSASMIGGAQVVSQLLGMVKMKVAALLLGPDGVGIMGTYSSITSMIGMATGFGIDGSAVRQVAIAVGSGDQAQIGRTTYALRRIVWALGLIGMAVMIAAAYPLSVGMFGTGAYAWPLVVLSVIILFNNVAMGQTAMLRGMRRISDMAGLSMLGALLGAVLSVTVFWILRARGIVPVLLLSSAAALFCSWLFVRRIAVPSHPPMCAGEVIREGRNLLTVGSVFLVQGIGAPLIANAVRAMVIRREGLNAVGIYQAAMMLSTILISFVLQGISMDFYPRLMACNADHDEMRRSVNEQLQIGVLLATPALLATIVLSPLLLRLFYSSKFSAGTGLVVWFVMGCLIDLLIWPIGLTLVAKGRNRLNIGIILFGYVLHVSLSWLGLHWYGLIGVAVAAVAKNVILLPLLVLAANRAAGYAMDMQAARFCGIAVGVCAGACALRLVFTPVWALAAGVVLTAVISIACLRIMVRNAGGSRLLVQVLNRWPVLQGLARFMGR